MACRCLLTGNRCQRIRGVGRFMFIICRGFCLVFGVLLVGSGVEWPLPGGVLDLEAVSSPG